MSFPEFRRRGLEVGAAGISVLFIGIALSILGPCAMGVVVVGAGSWLLGVAAMYLDPPGSPR